MATPTEAAVDAVFREEWGRIVASLIRHTGNWDLAEECAQDAFAEALRRWPVEGVPSKPGAWLTTVARNRAIDKLRRAKRGDQLLEQVARDPSFTAPAEDSAGVEDEVEEIVKASGIEDDRLRLIFTCCHPALALEGRVALTLRALAGLTTAEIAKAFLVSEPTMNKRLTRAKAKIAAAGIPYRVPPGHLLPERTGGVLAVLYLLFNEGYAASAGEELVRSQLCDEAIRLARLIVKLMPDEPEAAGLLALMLFSDSRRDARVGEAGELITLEHQDRSRWDSAAIAEARELLAGALRRGHAGPYQLQAAISGCHADAASVEQTDWHQIAGLYELLLEVLPSPVVRLNRAVAVAMAGDIDAALSEIDLLAAEGALEDYHLLEAARADLYRRRGHTAEAVAAYRRSLAAEPPERQRQFLQQRLDELEQ
jgi:RNA polymerase sigma-70 factor (ECF subfamily)